MAAGSEDKKKKPKKPRKKRVTQTGMQSSGTGKAAAKSKPKAKAAKAKSKATPKGKATPSKKKRGKAAEPTLPARALVLTDKDGGVSGVLPRHALVLVRRGIIVDSGMPAGVDPRPTQKAFMWLTGSRYGQGLDPSEPHQRTALRLVEFLVRAAVLSKPEDIEVIDELYDVLNESGVRPRDIDHDDAAPLSTSELTTTDWPRSGGDDSYD